MLYNSDSSYVIEEISEILYEEIKAMEIVNDDQVQFIEDFLSTDPNNHIRKCPTGSQSTQSTTNRTNTTSNTSRNKPKNRKSFRHYRQTGDDEKNDDDSDPNPV